MKEAAERLAEAEESASEHRRKGKQNDDLVIRHICSLQSACAESSIFFSYKNTINGTPVKDIPCWVGIRTRLRTVSADVGCHRRTERIVYRVFKRIL